MYRIIIFGGTSEGRLIAEYCSEQKIEALYLCTTKLGELNLPYITIMTGALEENDMRALFERTKPRLVIDATHPYAKNATKNIRAAAGTLYCRIARTRSDTSSCISFSNSDALVNYLSARPGNIFAAIGIKSVSIFAKIPDFKTRVFFRCMPSIEGLKTCFELGFPASNLILMQGPFSVEMNRVMFRDCNAKILVTKDSGAPGGFNEKAEAARELGITIALLERPPEDEGGITVESACQKIKTIQGSLA